MAFVITELKETKSKTIAKATRFNYNKKEDKFTALKKDGSNNTVKKGTSIVINEKAVKKGKDKDGYYHVKEVGNKSDTFWIKMNTVKDTNVKNKNTNRKEGIGKLQSMNSYDVLDSYHIDPSKVFYGSLNGIYGSPYQFMPLTDIPAAQGTSFGRTFADRIVSRMPIVIMIPGYPYFLPAFYKDSSKQVLAQLAATATNLKTNIQSTILNGIVGKSSNETRYYSFHEDTANYFKYVNTMLRYCAICLGIQEYYHRSVYNVSFFEDLGIITNSKHTTSSYHEKLVNYRWDKAINKGIKNIINAGSSNNFIAFYVDSETSVSESISNGTTSSQLVDQFNQSSSSVKEIKYLAGGVAGFGKPMNEDDYESGKSTIMSALSKITGNGTNKIFNNIDEAFKTIGKGGRLIFPEIWDDSEFSKSYSFSLKLRTPDGDKLSWFLNICVPLIHLLAFAAPRSLGANGYKTPFLVRAYYKGIFNIDMGIITNMSITKGKDAAWTIDGLPTEVDVSIDIKDLYSSLSISKSDKSLKNFLHHTKLFKFIKNTALFDYLSNTCGININAPEFARSMQVMYAMKLKGGLSAALQDTFGNIGNVMADAVFNSQLDMYEKHFKA